MAVLTVLCKAGLSPDLYSEFIFGLICHISRGKCIMCSPDLQARLGYRLLVSLEFASWLKTSYFRVSRQRRGPYAASKVREGIPHHRCQSYVIPRQVTWDTAALLNLCVNYSSVQAIPTTSPLRWSKTLINQLWSCFAYPIYMATQCKI